MTAVLIGQRCSGTLAGAGGSGVSCGGRQVEVAVPGVSASSRGAGGSGCAGLASVKRKGW
eukprot:4013870-Amphidinium_carterae.2